jgi:hypothetical protein
LGSLAFGVFPLAAPRQFGEIFGIEGAERPTVLAAVRSVGIRDAVLGIGLWSAATHGGRYAPWLLARALSDAGDAIAVALALRGGARSPRFLLLGGLAVGASLVGAILYGVARRARP